MSKENPSNFHWKNRLEDVESLSGETLKDKNILWEKLYTRLHQKPRNTRLWYWIAAACVILIIIIPVVNHNKKQDALAKINPAKSRSNKAIVLQQSPSPVNKDAAVNITSSIEKKQAAETAIQTNKKHKGTGNIIKEEAISPVSDNVQKEAVILPPVILETPVETTIALVPVKNKLKVVHLNELGDAVEEIPNTARYYENHSFQLKLINQQVYTPPAPTNNTAFNIFKPKATLSN